MDVFDLFAKISLDTSEYESGLEGAGETTSSFGDKLKTGLATAAKVGAAAITAVTTATAAMTTALIKGVSETAEYGDNIDKMSQKMGLSAEAYQEWDAILQHSGSSIETMKASMKTLATAAETGSDAFDQLGLSQEAIAEMSQEDLFGATISALQNVESETERTYLAGQLLGRGATELGALLNTSAEDTEAMRQRVHELGGVMSDEAVKAAAAYQDSLQDMKTAFSGLSRNMISEFMPSITYVMDGLTEIFSGNGDTGITMVSEGLTGLMENIIDSVPRVVEAGGQIVGSLLGVIMQNAPLLINSGVELVGELILGIVQEIPTLVSAVPEIIGSIVSTISGLFPDILDVGMQLLDQFTGGIETGIPDMVSRIPQIIEQFLNFITENLPSILEKGVEILNSLVNGILTAIPEFVSHLPEIITAFVNFVANNLPTIVESGISLLLNLVVGIIKAIPELVKALPQIITAIVQGIASLMGSVVDVGKNIVKGIWEGIQAMASWIKGKVTGFFSGIVSSVKGILGIKSPSKVFAGIGGFMAEGLGEGWEDAYSSIKKRIEGDMNFGTAKVDFASSGIGQSSKVLQSAILSSSGAQTPVMQSGNYQINLVLPNGTKIASWLVPILKNYDRAYGV